MSYVDEITEKFQRDTLAEMLAQCTDKQRRLFDRMYPNGPRRDQLPWAITQCHNTLIKRVDSGAGEKE